MVLVILVNAQDAEKDSILRQHFEKTGGRDTWKHLKSYYVSQSYFSNFTYSHSNNSSLHNQLKVKLQNTFYQYPDKYRVEIYWDGELQGTFLTNTKEAKGYNHLGRYEERYSETMQKLMLAMNQVYPLGPTPLILSATERDSIEYKGLVRIYDKDCYKLMFKTKGFSGQFIVYLDEETYLVHASSNVDSPEKYKIYSDYRFVDGIKVPHKLTSYEKGEISEEFNILESEINKEIDEYIFTTW